MKELASKLKPSHKFPNQVWYDPKLPEFEIVKRGFC